MQLPHDKVFECATNVCDAQMQVLLFNVFRKMNGSPYPPLLGGISVIDEREYFCEPFMQEIMDFIGTPPIFFIDRLLKEFRTIFMKYQF